MRTKLEKQLLAALEDACSRMEAVSAGILVHKRHKGVSIATHVAHMAGHLEQHAKKARDVITVLTSREEAETRPQANASHQETDTRAALEAILKAFDDGELRDLNDAIEASRAALTSKEVKLFIVWNDTDEVQESGTLMCHTDAMGYMDYLLERHRKRGYWIDEDDQRRPLHELKLSLRPAP